MRSLFLDVISPTVDRVYSYGGIALLAALAVIVIVIVVAIVMRRKKKK